MKKITLLICALICVLSSLFGQEYDVYAEEEKSVANQRKDTAFQKTYDGEVLKCLGVPVDGTMKEAKKALTGKGAKSMFLMNTDAYTSYFKYKDEIVSVKIDKETKKVYMIIRLVYFESPTQAEQFFRQACESIANNHDFKLVSQNDVNSTYSDGSMGFVFLRDESQLQSVWINIDRTVLDNEKTTIGILYRNEHNEIEQNRDFEL